MLLAWLVSGFVWIVWGDSEGDSITDLFFCLQVVDNEGHGKNGAGERFMTVREEDIMTNAFAIGKSRTFVAPASGELVRSSFMYPYSDT